MHVGIGLVLVKNEPKVLLVLILAVVSLEHQIAKPQGAEKRNNENQSQTRTDEQ